MPAGSLSTPLVVVEAKSRAVWWNQVEQSLVRSVWLVPAWTRS
ncbi:hypothetical protein ACFXAS_13880 [Streptomyces sp. NPDC059459]